MPPPPTVAKVPEVGKVTLVFPVKLKVTEYAPVVASGPPNVSVDVPAFDTPVPPSVGDKDEVRPRSCVISEFTPDFAAEILVRAVADVPHFDNSDSA